MSLQNVGKLLPCYATLHPVSWYLLGYHFVNHKPSSGFSIFGRAQEDLPS